MATKTNEVYHVTARKWRPSNFDELRGQEHISKTLSQIIDSGKISHAYLFSGPRGCGKTTTSRILAKCLNCETGPTMSPCNECTNCKEITTGISPDVLEIDGASNRGVDRIRELRENVRYLPAKSKYKVYIIDEVHMLTTESFNALLKTLEEPPDHVIFIFATTEPHKVKITVRSRCQHFIFKRMTLDTLKSQIKLILDSYEVKYDEPSVEAIARAADGSMRDSQSIMDQVIAYCGDSITIKDTRMVLGDSGDENYHQFVKFLLNKDLSGIVNLIEDINMKGFDLNNFSLGLMETFRNLTIIKALPEESPAIIDLSNEQINEMKELCSKFDVYQLREITRRTINLNNEIKNTSNQRFLFESYVFNIIDYENFVSLGSVIKRIEKLEQELSSLDDADITISDEYIKEVLSKQSEISKEVSSENNSENSSLENDSKKKDIKSITQKANLENGIEQGPKINNQVKSSTKVLVKEDNSLIVDKKPDSEIYSSEKPRLEKDKNLEKNKNVEIKVPKNYLSLIGEKLKNNGQMLTSQCVMRTTKSEIDTKQRSLNLYFYDEYSLDRCQNDKSLIEDIIEKVLGISFKLIISKSDTIHYGKEEFLTNKENIKRIFDGKELD